MDEWVLKLKNGEEGESSLACNPVGSLLKIQIEDHLLMIGVGGSLAFTAIVAWVVWSIWFQGA